MKIKANGIDIHYTIDGDGPWLTMSHSLACNLRMWDEQMDLLTRRFKVLRYDTRGHGETGTTGGAYTLDGLADDAKALLDALGIRETHWIGLSLGGMIGETFALKYPGIFKTLVLADTTSRRPPNAEKMWGDRVAIARAQGMQALVDSTLGRWFTEPYRAARTDVMKRIGGMIVSTPVDGYAGCCTAIAKVDLTDRLKEITCPTLIIVGDQDHGTPPDMAREIHANMPGSELVIIPSAAHLSNVEQTAAFNEALARFYDRVAA